MSDYTLHISSFAGLVGGAYHYSGRIEGPRPSCPEGHESVLFNPQGTFCREGHPVPDKTTWDVQRPMTEDEHRRWMASFSRDDDRVKPDGPSQFKSKRGVIEAAARRFVGQLDLLDSSDDQPELEPGDCLYYYCLPDPFMEEDNPGGLAGQLLAEVPEPGEEPTLLVGDALVAVAMNDKYERDEAWA